MSKAFISGCAGTHLNADEIAFFARERPWGLILFARNIETPAQVGALVAAFRKAVGDDAAPVLIDQEGGRVQRLRPPFWPSYPPGAAYGAIHRQDEKAAKRAAWLGARLMAHDLHDLGINVDCLPVLDVPVRGAHDVIGDRAYGEDVETVASLARAAANGLLAGGVLPVAKHVPGHGRAGADSHEALPRVDTDAATLETFDFEPFRRLADLPLAMTAHVVYETFDANAPATTSAALISRVIRGTIGFEGCLMSDDVSMQALSGSMAERARACVAAGCDLVLHCNGDFAEMTQVAATVPVLEGKARARTDGARAALTVPQALDVAAAWAEFRELTGRAAKS